MFSPPTPENRAFYEIMWDTVQPEDSMAHAQFILDN